MRTRGQLNKTFTSVITSVAIVSEVEKYYYIRLKIIIIIARHVDTCKCFFFFFFFF